MRDARLAAGVLAASLAYAIIRYNVFAAVSYEQLPLFVMNKAIAVTGLVLLGISRVVADKPRRKELGLAGLALALLHVILSLLVLDPAYLPAQYLPSAMLRWGAEASMLAGGIATVLLLWLAYATSTRPLERQGGTSSLLPGIARVMLVLVGAHTALLGYRGWADMGAWPGAMPPLTLLSSGIAAWFLLTPRGPAR